MIIHNGCDRIRLEETAGDYEVEGHKSSQLRN